MTVYRFTGADGYTELTNGHCYKIEEMRAKSVRLRDLDSGKDLNLTFVITKDEFEKHRDEGNLSVI